MKITKLILQIAALICSAGMFIYLVINGKEGIASDYFVDDYLISAVLSLLLLVGFNKDKWRYKHEVYSTVIKINSFAVFISSLFHCFVEVETYNRVIDNEFIAISAMYILPFAIFALAMIKTVYKKGGQLINNALPIVSMIIMLAFGIASYFIEDQSKHWIVIAIICVFIICSKIIENRILNKEALQDV